MMLRKLPITLIPEYLSCLFVNLQHRLILALLLFSLLPIQAADVELKSGLNLLSYPVSVPDTLTCNAFKTTLGADQLQQLQGPTQQFESCLDNNFIIQAGSGYIVYRADSALINLQGSADCPVIKLFQGVNLIGIPSPFADMGCFDALQVIGDSSVVSAIQRMNTDNGLFETCTYDAQSVIQGTDFKIKSGEAYLVNMKAELNNVELNDSSLCIANQLPEINSLPVLQTAIDTAYQYQLTATDADNDVLVYSLLTAPLGMTISGDTGQINWLPVNNGHFQITVMVDDGRGGTATQSYQLSVLFSDSSHPPVLSAIENQTAILGSKLQLQLAANDQDGDTISYTAKPIPLPAGMQLDSAQGLFTFKPGIDQVGSHEITFIASDGRFSDAETISIEVPQASGITSIRGKVLTTDGVPLANVRLEISEVESFTDINGDYLLDNLPVSGDVRLLIDGSTVDPDLGVFATVPEIIHLINGAANLLDPAIILLPLDVANADPVDPAVTSVISSGRFIDDLKIYEPVTLTIPPGRAIDDATGLPYVGDIHISRVTDPTQGPRPLPPSIGLSAYIAIQPFGVTYPQPIPISFPNMEDFPAGSRLDFFALNHETGKMEKIGEGLVSADGKTVDSIGGVVKSNSWHGIVPQEPVTDEDKTQGDQDRQKDCQKNPACRFSMETGNLGEDHFLPSYFSLGAARTVHLSYNSLNANPRPILNAKSGFGNAAPPPLSMSSRLNIAGMNMGEELFSEVKVVPSEIRTQFKPTRPAIQFNGTAFTTGVYDYAWTVDCHFPISRRSETLNGQVIIQNDQLSPFGAGWTLVGLQRIHLNAQGLALITEGNGVALSFKPIDANTYASPPADFSTLTKNLDNSFTRRLKDGTLYHFDSDGFLTDMQDRNGNTTQYIYDSGMRLTQIIDPVGKAFIFEYFANYLTSITDPDNRITRFEHDSAGNLIHIIEPGNDQRTFEYQSLSHLMAAQIDQRNNRTEYRYDFAGRIHEALLPDGSKAQLRPSAVDGLINPDSGLGHSKNLLAPPPNLLEDIKYQYIDHNGNVSSTETDPRGAAIKHTDAIGRITLTERDSHSNPVKTTRPNNSIINRSFDNFANLLSRREAFNDAIYTYTYDSFSLITSFTNPRNNKASYIRDAIGNVTQIINALGHTYLIEYDQRGLPTFMETPNGLIVNYAYNTQGLIETTTETPPQDSPGNVRVTQYSYDDVGQTTQIITPDNIVLDLVYDDKGRLNRVSDNLNQFVDYHYDAFNNLIATDTHNANGDLALTVTRAFDTRNRLTTLSAPHNPAEDSIDQRILDNNSNITGLIDPNGNPSSHLFDGEDRLIESTHRLNGISTYEYDTNNRITKVVAANGATTIFTYDVLGRRLTETSPDRGTLTYTYDLANNITSIIDARGIDISFTYDQLERVKSKTFPNTLAGKNENVSYTYDNCSFGLSRLCQRTDESGLYDYQYDAFGNKVSLSRTELGIQYTTEYIYDNGDQLIQATYPTGRVVNYGRDGVRRIESIDTLVNGQQQAIASAIQYRGDNRMTQCTFGNGLIDNRSYDQQGRLFQQLLKTQGGQIIDERHYSFDLNGNIEDRATTPQNSHYSYDPLDRIIADDINSSVPFTYSYDLNDNRLTKSHGADLNEIYTHTPGSNRLDRKNTTSVDALPPVANDRDLVFNDANRLFQVIEAGELKAEYFYNDENQRTRKIIYQTGNPEQTILFHYDTMGYLISETDAQGNVIRDYIWPEGMYPMAQIDRVGANERISYLHTDHLMTNRLATNQNQEVIWRWEGEAFGNTPAQEIVGVQVNLRFPGQYIDGETGLYYNWNRYYDSELGRYVSSDPIGFTGGGMNLYRYATNNPLSLFDPNGLFSMDDVIDVVGNFLCAAMDAFSGMGCTVVSVVSKDPENFKKGIDEFRDESTEEEILWCIIATEQTRQECQKELRELREEREKQKSDEQDEDCP